MNDKNATIAGLQKLGYKEVHRSRKYRCFEEPKPEGVPFRTFLVGKSGALRLIGANCSRISESISRTGSRQHKALQYIGRLNVELPVDSLWGVYDTFVKNGKMV